MAIFTWPFTRCWLQVNEHVLIQLAVGPEWSESNDWGWSSIAILNGNFTEWIELLVGKEETINTGAVFIRHYNDLIVSIS